MTEIDIASDQEHAERGGTAATDLQLESEQRATQASAARTAREADGQSVPLPHCRSIVTCLGMADGEACNFQQANEPSRPHISLAGEEQALHGSFFVDIPDEINRVHIGDLLRMSEAFAAVIVEGREEQTDGGERNEGPKTNPNQTPKPAGRNSTIL